MAASFLFYDLETSGINPREARVMQFAAQRTDEALNPIGEPFNYFIRLTPDVLPDPQAVLVTGITPQKTLEEGLTEHEFLQIFQEKVATPGTIFTGFNSVRFDDEFMRYLHFRNFRDPYEWSWAEGRSRWDMLDVIRMTRALRPDGIQWPSTEEGVPTNRLELLTKVNKLAHEHAHDALSDVMATIGIAALIRDKQPKLFDYLLQMRSKRSVQSLVNSGEPFVYTSGRYDNEFEKTTAAVKLTQSPEQPQAIVVYDLRHDPALYVDKTEDELFEAWRLPQKERPFPIPVKTLRFNRCPAVAPLGVLDKQSRVRLELEPNELSLRLSTLRASREQLAERFMGALSRLQSERQAHYATEKVDAEAQLYDGFIPDVDKPVMKQIVEADPSELSADAFRLRDERLQKILPLYKARNFPDYLTPEEHAKWEAYRQERLLSGDDNSRFRQFVQQLRAAAVDEINQTPERRYILEEVQLYAESIVPLQE